MDIKGHFKKILLSKTSTDAFVVLLGSGISAGLGFLFIAVVARKMTPEEFGMFSTVLNYCLFLSAIVDLGISQSLVQFIPKAKSFEEIKKLVSSGFASLLLSSTFLALLSSAFYYFYLSYQWKHDPNNVLYIFPTIFVIVIAMFFLGLFQSLKDFWYRSLSDNLFSFSRIGIIFFILYFAKITVSMSMWSIVWAYVIAIVISWYWSQEYFSVQVVEKNLALKMLNFGKWLAGVALFGTLYIKLDVMMLAWFSTKYETGIYSAAARFILFFPLIASSLSSVVSPRYAKFEYLHEVHDYFKQIFSISAVVTVAMAFMIVIAKPIILIPYSDKYAEAIPVFQLLVISYLPLIMSIPATNAVVYFFKKPKIITWIAGVQVVGLFILNSIFIPKYSMYGPALSLGLMNFFGMSCQYIAYWYLYKKWGEKEFLK